MLLSKRLHTDTDGSGKLDQNEFLRFMNIFMRTKELSLSVDVIDDLLMRVSEGDMLITFPQFEAWWNDYRSMCLAAE